MAAKPTVSRATRAGVTCYVVDVRISILAIVVACGGSTTLPPHDRGPYAPVAEPRAHTITSPSGNREDPYYWLRDDTRKDPAVLGYLTAEAKYAAAMLAPVKQLEADVFAELR